MSIFQFTPLREGRLRVEFTHAEQLISIHAPPRGATGDDGKQIAVVDISIHAPPRGATVPGKPVSLGTEHFNSRPSARGDAKALMDAVKAKISIHAPPRGATERSRRESGRRSYFNSRPSARGDWHWRWG